jgi:hypothetical protein
VLLEEPILSLLANTQVVLANPSEESGVNAQSMAKTLMLFFIVCS